MTKVVVEDILYLVIALRKLEKPVVREAPVGAFRYFREVQRRRGNGEMLLLPEDEFKAFFHELKVCFRKHPVHKEVLDKMGFPKKWEKIGRMKKYTKAEL